jgi:hypothetical protein
MSTRQGGDNGNGFDEAGLGSSPPSAPASAISANDRLEYIADMLRELHVISEQTNCPALTSLLGCAHREALRRRRAGP